MNAHEAAAKNIKLKLVRDGKAYDKTFEVRLPLPVSMGHCPRFVHVKPIGSPPTAKSKVWLRVNRITQETSVASNAGRAKGAGVSGNVQSMFGRPLARREG